MVSKKKFSVSQLAWDLWCTLSIIGIWPRFIEHRLLSVTRLDLLVPNLPKSLDSFKILHFSDLHVDNETSDAFLTKLSKKILKESPDLIVFTGDFLVYSKFENTDKLKNFLNSLHAPFGCFAVLGNHDYEKFVSVNEKGEYDVIEKSDSTLKRGFKRLFSHLNLKKVTTEAAKNVKLHLPLLDLLKETPFKVLHNEHVVLNVQDAKLNLVGVGEYSLAKSLPDIAFKNLDPSLTTCVLSHNPDALSLLKDYPSDIILSGHTHGAQVNLPWFRNKFLLTENNRLIRGYVLEENKKIYITKGVGSVMKFRWFAKPEIVCLTLKKEVQK